MSEPAQDTAKESELIAPLSSILMVHIETIVGMFYGENINEIKRLNIQSVFVFFLV